MADSLTVCGQNISKNKQDMLKLLNNLLNDFKNFFKWAKNIFRCQFPLVPTSKTVRFHIENSTIKIEIAWHEFVLFKNNLEYSSPILSIINKIS